MADQPHKIILKEEFKTCPPCNYSDGFYSTLKRDEEEISLLFVYPACHDMFDVGQTLK